LGNVQTQIKKKPFSVMKNLLLSFVLLLPLLSIAQNSHVYESHEVDSVAVPQGGHHYLTIFINTNLQIPYMAKVAKVNGYVSLAGVVDEQGKISQIEVIKGIRPDCDREAVRVFGLFNAWQAALKGGKSVRQKVTHQVVFKSTENTTFVSGKQVNFLDENFSFTNDSLKRRYVQKSLIDTLSEISIKNIEIFELKENDKEKLFTTLKPYVEIDINYSLVYPEPLQDTSISRIRVKYYSENESNVVGDILIFWGNGNLQQKRYKTIENSDFPFVLFYANGMVREWTDFADDKRIDYQTTSWYPNGQIEKIIRHENPSKRIFDITDLWNENGIQLVKNGEGEAILKYYQDDYKILILRGVVANHKKKGIWKGYLEENNKVIYRENYKNGVFESGVSYEVEGDSVAYENQMETFAEYQGGMRAFGKHLQQTLKYPAEAQKRNAQGKAFIQFTVCTDGTLCDYRVSKSTGNNELDKEAMRVVKASSGKWNSAIRRGRRVRTRFTMPVNFILAR
jgi:TonB family protein